MNNRFQLEDQQKQQQHNNYNVDVKKQEHETIALNNKKNKYTKHKTNEEN